MTQSGYKMPLLEAVASSDMNKSATLSLPGESVDAVDGQMAEGKLNPGWPC